MASRRCLKLLRSIIAAVTLLSLVSCSPKSSTTTPSSAIPPGSLMQENIAFQFAVYYLPVPTNNPTAILDTLLIEKFPNARRVAKLSNSTEGVCIASQLETNVQESYSPPNPGSLKYFGRGLSREQALALYKSQQALLLNFGYSKAHVWDGMRLALLLSSALARQTGGILWDAETREAFIPDTWETNRLATWDAEVPDISRHTTMHAYRKEEEGFVRAITLGMIKFGLPDLVIEDFSWSQNRNIGHLINLFGQTIAEGASVRKAGEFDLDIRAIKNYRVRDPQISSLKSNATAKALLSLRVGRREEGDPWNRLVEITFDRYTPRDLHARQEALLSAMFGWEDLVSGIRHDEALLAASQKAREKLPALREHFNKSIQPGEYVLVKVPFPTPKGGNEYMWVEISSWNGDNIKGLLRNEPVSIPSLHGGQMVEVSEAKIFDYIHTLPDGTREGNETSKLIQAQEQRIKK
jgi:uncharacterized protein YegJ (DUF2314 family)